MSSDVELLLSLANEIREAQLPEYGGVAAVEVALGPGQMAPLHADVADEAVLALDGELTLYAGRLLQLVAGERHLVRAGTHHAYAAGPRGGRILVARAVRSLARYEEFVRAVGVPGGAQDADDLARLATIGAVNGISVIGSGDAVLRTQVLELVEGGEVSAAPRTGRRTARAWGRRRLP